MKAQVRLVLTGWLLSIAAMGCQAASGKDVGADVTPYEVTDLAGRTLTFDKVPQRVILGESRYLAVLSILDQDDPVKPIVGMLSDLKGIDYGTYRQYQEKYPHIDDIATVGHNSGDSFSVEQALTLNADLAIFGVSGHGPNARQERLISQLEQAGVKVVFVDFRNSPLVNTPKSVALLGKILGKEAQSQAYIDFYQQQLTRVSSRLESAMKKGPVPNVFLHSRVGVQDLCCETMVRGMMAAFVDEAGGRNAAIDLLPGSAGIINLEYLLNTQPDFYIATGIGSTNVKKTAPEDTPPYIVVGAGVDEDKARRSFQYAIKQTGVSNLEAVQNQRAYAIWHHFYNSPLNVIAVQVFAKWLYPELFEDLDPRATLEALYQQFQAVPLDGVYWVSLQNQGEP